MYDIVVRLGALAVALLGVTCAVPEVMTNTWLVRLHGNPGVRVARDVAARNGFSYVSPVSTHVVFVKVTIAQQICKLKCP